MTEFLAVDIGNTRVKIGILTTSPSSTVLPDCTDLYVMPVRACDDLRPFRKWLDSRGRLGLTANAVVADVNPMITQDLLRAWREEFDRVPRRVTRPSSELLVNLTDAPQKVGPDRLFNAVAVNRIRVEGKSVVIVDSGTATTVDVVTGDGEFAGGAILPGFRLSAQALHDYTALLPAVPSDDVMGEVPEPLGRDTRSAIRSGLYWGGIGSVRELVSRLEAALPAPTLKILTGGAAPRLVPHFPDMRHFPLLALQGLGLTAMWEEAVGSDIATDE